MNPNTIETGEVKKKLCKYTQGEIFSINMFAGLLASRLHDHESPESFFMAVESLLSDLEKGYDSREGGHFQDHRPIAGNDPGFYTILRTQIPKMVRACFPEDFAQATIEVMEKLYR